METLDNDMELLALAQSGGTGLPLPAIPKRASVGGRAIFADAVVELTDEDMQRILSGEEEEIKLDDGPNAGLKQIRARHHRAASMIAQGYDYSFIHRETGISTNRLSTLNQDPSFAALVEHYRQAVVLEDANVRQKLLDLSDIAAEVLGDRLEDAPESFTNGQLLDVIKVTADRSGNGPQTTQRVEGAIMHLTPDDIKGIKSEALQANVGRTNLIRQTRTLAIAATPQDKEPSLGDVMRTALPVGEIGEEGPGQQAQGPDLREQGREVLEGEVS